MTAVSKYHVFLSHNGQDKPQVEQIAQRLVSETKLQPFLDKWHLVPGDPWQSELADALARSATVAVFFGPSGNGPWQNEEMQVALNRAVSEREFRVIPVVLPGASEDSIPDLLKLRTWVDFRDGINSDIAFKRLVAGIRGLATEFEGIKLPDEPAPYRGLMHFESKHDRFFFGREQEIGPTQDGTGLIDRLRVNRFVAVVGPSGSGKSSLVRAGLLPRLKRDAIPGSRHWRQITFTPADDPFRSLANALVSELPVSERGRTVTDLLVQFDEPESGLRHTLETWFTDTSDPLLLFVDQFEELFTHAPSSRSNAAARERYDERIGRFVNQLAHEALRPDGRFRVVITVRADFMPHCLRVPELKNLLQDRQLLLGELARDEGALREVIQRPAQEVGAMLETGLVDVLLADVRGRTGVLPLLEHALSELWSNRRGPWLTLEAYHKTGGVSGALEQRAEETLQRLSKSQQQIARRIFVKLTSLEDGTEDTRRRVFRQSLYAETADNTEVDTVIKILAGPETRLIVADSESLSIAHETLIQNWPRLRDWLKDDRELERVHRELERAANDWEAHSRGKPYLFQAASAKLAETEEHAPALADRITSLERAFLDACREAREADKAEEERGLQEKLKLAEDLAAAEAARAQQKEHDAEKLRRNTRFAVGIAVVACLFLVAAVLGWIAEQAASQRAAQKEAEAQRETAEAQRQTANVWWQTGVTARDQQSDSVKASDCFLRAVMVMDQIPEHVTTRRDREFRQNLQWVAAFSVRSLIRTMPHDGGVGGAQFNSDESQVLSWSDDGTVRLWDLHRGMEPLAVFTHEGPVDGARFSRDELRVLSWSWNKAAGIGEIRVWEVGKRERLQVFKCKGMVGGAEFNRDASKVLSWSDNAPVDAAGTVPADGDQSKNAGASGSKGSVRLWDLTKAEPLSVFPHQGRVAGAQFSRDESRVLSWGGDSKRGIGEVRLWEVGRPEPRAVFKHELAVRGADFNPDESRVLSWSLDGTVQLWEVGEEEPLAVLPHDGIIGARFTRHGSYVLSWGGGELRLWHRRSTEPTKFCTDYGEILGAQFSHNELQALTWSEDHTVRLWGLREETLLSTFPHDAEVSGAEWTRDESRLLSWGGGLSPEAGKILLWDVKTGSVLAVFKHERAVRGVQRTKDDSTLLSWDGEPILSYLEDEASEERGVVRLWDVSKAAPTAIPIPGVPLRGVQFSRNGALALFLFDADENQVWDVRKAERLAEFRGADEILGAQFSRDGKRVLTCARTAVRVWEVGQVEPVAAFEDKDEFRAASFNLDESRVLTCSEDGTVRTWEVGGKEPVEASKHKFRLRGAQFSDGGARVFCWSDDSTVQVWEVGNPQPIADSKYEGKVLGANFSSDASRVLSWTDGGAVQLWDTGETVPSAVFKHHGPVAGAQFSPDESRVLSWSDDGTVWLWDTGHGEPLAVFKHEAAVVGVRFSDDESQLLTWSENGTMRVWDISEPDRGLTPKERILELEVRSATALEGSRRFRTLAYDEWIKKARQFQQTQTAAPRKGKDK